MCEIVQPVININKIYTYTVRIFFCHYLIRMETYTRGKQTKLASISSRFCVLLYDRGTPLPRCGVLEIHRESAQTRSTGTTFNMITIIIIIAIIIIIIKITIRCKDSFVCFFLCRYYRYIIIRRMCNSSLHVFGGPVHVILLLY